MADDQKPFWSSLPGILTGIAALLTAATGLIAAFHSHNKSSSDAQANQPAIVQPVSPSTQKSVAPAASSGASQASGFWSGSADGLRMAVLNLDAKTFERPCVSDRVFGVNSAVWQGTNLIVTISDLGNVGKDHRPAAPIEFDLTQQDGKLTGTYNQAKRHSAITFAPGKQGCPAGATESDS